MLLQVEDWHVGYSQILHDCRKSTDEAEGGASVLILAHADVDALCSARILSYMLRADGISYELRPCRSYQSLLEISASIARDQLSYRALVLLNLGAHRDLGKLFDENEDGGPNLPLDTMKVYIMDSHRPVHLKNLYSLHGDNVVVFLDTVEGVPSDGDDISANESSTDEEDSDSESEDQDEGETEFQDELSEEENEFGAENDPLSDAEDGPDPADSSPSKPDGEFGRDGDDEYDAEDEGEGGRKRSREGKDTDDDDASMSSDDGKNVSMTTQTTAPASPEDTQDASAIMTSQQIEDRRARVRAYYNSGSTYGSPASFCAYKIATQLRFGDLGDLLWLACVGVTDAYLHSRLDVAGYSQFAIFLRDYCNRLFPNDMYYRVGNDVYAEHLTNIPVDHSSTRTKLTFSSTGTILSETDFRFFLLRHSSLLDGMRYSDYCASKLGNQNTALPRIHEMLAKMGFPLADSQQPFALMKPKFRQRLRDRIRQYAPEYGLDNLEFTSFFRVTGYKSLISASDMTYAATALLESLDATIDDDKTDDERLLESFHRAYEALNSYATAPSTLSLHNVNSTSLVNGAPGGGGLATGLRLAMARQRAILSTAASLVERNAIVRLSHFRYAYVTSNIRSGGDDDWQTGNPQDVAASRSLEDVLFSKPLALLRLAHYLMDVHRENGKWTGSRARPLVLVAARNADTYLVSGYEFAEESGSVVANSFGKHFELVAQSMQGTFRFESFDSNVVEVDTKDVQRFIEQLHYLLDTA
jgi:cell division control protein 45